ncbi:MAG: seryl-tRNA synthetase [Parcubacteria group bacterium Gr01-1014_2]|nr:MAG: seryl-tRNA synthetase [Parcubacteria group bacterium Gr01-1014_2]
MLDIKFIRQNSEEVKEGLRKRNFDIEIIDKIISLDERRRHVLKELEEGKAEINRKSKGMPAASEIEDLKKVKEKIKILESELELVEKDLNENLYQLPNLPLPDVPVGKSERDNKVLYEVGERPKFSAKGGSAAGGNFEPKKHYELGESLDIIDTKRAAKVSGSRFGYIKGFAAQLEFVLTQFVLSILTSEKELKKIAKKINKNYSPKPFIPVIPPVLIKPEVFKKMARLNEEDKEERYYIPKDDLYLIGSAEHTLGPMHMGEIIDEKDLPIRYIGFSASFRRESGSYGKDVRGIMRVHQFNKLEMESFSAPEDSIKEQDFFVAIQEYLMQKLEIPYRVVIISTGDMGKPDARQIDIEAWMPGSGEYRETHTADLMTDYQARRLNTRLRRKNGDLEFVHMNDATAFAERTILAILENYQQKDGSIKIPKVLKRYF